MLAIESESGKLVDVVLHETWDVEDAPYLEAMSEDSDAYYEPLSSSDEEESAGEEATELDEQPHTPKRSLGSDIIAPRRPSTDRTSPDSSRDESATISLALQSPSPKNSADDDSHPQVSPTPSATLNSLVGLLARRSKKRHLEEDDSEGEVSSVKRARGGGS